MYTSKYGIFTKRWSWAKNGYNSRCIPFIENKNDFTIRNENAGNFHADEDENNFVIISDYFYVGEVEKKNKDPT